MIAPPQSTKLAVFPVLYVSPDAHHWGVFNEQAHWYARDLSQVDDDGVGRVYRRCDLMWFAWLVHRTAQARRLVAERQLAASTVAPIYHRLQQVRSWALRQWDRNAITTAINAGIPPTYQPPKRRLLRDHQGKAFSCK